MAPWQPVITNKLQRQRWLEQLPSVFTVRWISRLPSLSRRLKVGIQAWASEQSGDSFYILISCHLEAAMKRLLCQTLWECGRRCAPHVPVQVLWITRTRVANYNLTRLLSAPDSLATCLVSSSPRQLLEKKITGPALRRVACRSPTADQTRRLVY